MRISFHRIYTKDGLELAGLLCQPNKKTKIVLAQVHGMEGNFYRDNFLKVGGQMKGYPLMAAFREKIF